MDKQQFIENLKSNITELAIKAECCQFFINNYPVKIRSIGFNGYNEQWTKLDGITIAGGDELLINHAFDSLVKRVKELEEFG